MVAHVTLLVTLNLSTAECERQFSPMNPINTSLSNSLGQKNRCELTLMVLFIPKIRKVLANHRLANF